MIFLSMIVWTTLAHCTAYKNELRIHSFPNDSAVTVASTPLSSGLPTSEDVTIQFAFPGATGDAPITLDFSRGTSHIQFQITRRDQSYIFSSGDKQMAQNRDDGNAHKFTIHFQNEADLATLDGASIAVPNLPYIPDLLTVETDGKGGTISDLSLLATTDSGGTVTQVGCPDFTDIHAFLSFLRAGDNWTWEQMASAPWRVRYIQFTIDSESVDHTYRYLNGTLSRSDYTVLHKTTVGDVSAEFKQPHTTFQSGESKQISLRQSLGDRSIDVNVNGTWQAFVGTNLLTNVYPGDALPFLGGFSSPQVDGKFLPEILQDITTPIGVVPTWLTGYQEYSQNSFIISQAKRGDYTPYDWVSQLFLFYEFYLRHDHQYVPPPPDFIAVNPTIVFPTAVSQATTDTARSYTLLVQCTMK